jgi:hypothetical protein
MRVRLRPTIAADFEALVGRAPPFRVRCITAELDGRPIGLGGLGFRPDGVVIAFAQLADALRRYPAAVHRAGLAGMAMIRASGVPVVVAQADPDPAAERWLRHFGFEPVEGGRVFVWRR